ncbi:MAG TPA: type IX secretion system protein PorQ [Chitinophagaceae bacterium]|nr:type IX secretion system protein PorQ [Chitinophagaceae bacterium]
MKGIILVIFSISLKLSVLSQTLGGDAAFNFLKVSPSPQLTALGGVNGSVISNDVSLTYYNPALLRPSLHGQVAADFSLFYAGIKNIHSQAAYYKENWNTTFGIGVNYFHYGTADQTDASGNIMGSFRPYDYAVQVSAGRKYLERWFYGASLKYIQSSYGMYGSNAIALDFGLNYYDSSSSLQVYFLARNMGSQLKTYGGEPEDMPFDLQAGVTKRLKNAPFQFSIAAQRLHQFKLVYNDTSFNSSEGVAGPTDNFATNLFRHLVFATQVYIGERLEFTIGYNALRRAELSLYNSTNGLTGISFGAGVNLKKMQIRYSRSQYQASTGVNQFGINIQL